jgi:hypothetical protein
LFYDFGEGFVGSFGFFNRGKVAMMNFLGLGFGSSVVVLDGFVSIFAYKADVPGVLLIAKPNSLAADSNISTMTSTPAKWITRSEPVGLSGEWPAIGNSVFDPGERILSNILRFNPHH